MGKKKKSKNVNVSLLALTESPQEAAQERKEEVSKYNYPGILTQRLDERFLPDWAAEKLAELQSPQQQQPETPSGGMEMT